MYINCNKDIVLETAFKLSLTHGFDNISIKQIQNEANLSAGTIYYYFKDKDAILLSMLDKYVKEEIKIFANNIRNYEGTFSEKLKFIFYHSIGVELNNETHGVKLSDSSIINHKEFNLFLMSTYHKHPEIRHIYHEINEITHDIYANIADEFKEKNEIRKDIDSVDIAIYIYTVITGFIELWISTPNIPLEKIIDSNIMMVCDSLAVRD